MSAWAEWAAQGAAGDPAQPPGGLLCPDVPQCPFPRGVGLGLSEASFVPERH